LVGAADISLGTVFEAVFSAESMTSEHRVIRLVRLPRVAMAALVGASLATAGAVMQAMTRNPLAGPTIMGLNAGASFAVVLAFAFAPVLAYTGVIISSFLGAALGAGLTYGITYLSPGGNRPGKLAIAGAAVGALLEALTRGMVVVFELAQDVLFYTAGGVQGTQWEQVALATPWIAAGLGAAILLAPSLSVLSFGSAVAIGVGARVRAVRGVATVAVLLLAGSAVSVAGGVGFVGLAVPHIARFLTGPDYRWVIPGSMILGAALVVLADLGARMVNPPYETPVGLITAIVGVPFFLLLARRRT
jgi:iron complex transport system permease protein